MALEIKVGPPQIAIHQGAAVLITEPDGQVLWPTDKGLYFRDTRLLSNWSLYADGVEWDLLNSGTPAYSSARIYLTNRAVATQKGEIAPHTLSLVLGRRIGDGIHEDIDLTNHGAGPVKFNLEIALRSDFADIFEVKSGRIVRRGRITTDWSNSSQCLTNVYTNQDFRRGLVVTASGDTAAVYSNGRLSFGLEILPGATWHTCLLYEFLDGDTKFSAPGQHANDGEPDKSSLALDAWRSQVLKIETSNIGFARLFAQAVDDMAALRLPVLGSAGANMGHLDIVPAAGLPWFVALFGRDSLIVSLQNALVYSDFARGALEVLGKWQAHERDDFRDAEPGKILHELRRGELAHFKLIPHTPYYGTADATPLYLITLHVAWLCTGDRSLLDQHIETAEGCLRWIDAWGDRDGDGFQEYQTRSKAGYENMAWKDAGDAVMNLDGSPVSGPKALCELQGYVYDAWQRMAEVFDVLGKPDRATELRGKAARLGAKFNEAFWDEASGFYAYALDGDKKQVLTVASNPGHLLWSGIVPRDRAARVIARLMQPDMWSGWGIRTLSSRHVAFNPYSYQNGSVWPHDNGLIAQGMKRYGFATEANQLAQDVMSAASFFMLNQLPELYAGIQRDQADFPVQYLGANVPQAWAAGSVFSLLQAVLGFQPDAPGKMLYLDPVLPEWLPDLLVRDLRVGDQVFDISFTREDGETAFEVLRGDASAVARRRMETGFPAA
jgi:glycogen debranching enzyme